MLASLHATLLCWTPCAVPAANALYARSRPLYAAGALYPRSRSLYAQLDLPPGFDINELPDWATADREPKKAGARAKRNEVSDYAKSMGAEKGYAKVDDFVREHVPAAGQPGQRRRKKQWDPSKRKPHQREQRMAERRAAKEASTGPPPLSHAELLRVARPVLAAAANGVGVEFVGVVLMRPPRGTTPSAFRCWVASSRTEEEEAPILSADELSRASSALRDGLWATIAGKPAISVIAVSSDARSRRPLFDASDFDRFRGRRVQLTFREAHQGRRRLVGELRGTGTCPGTGAEQQEPEQGPPPPEQQSVEPAGELCAIVMDESARAAVFAPLSKLLLGEKTALYPRDEAPATAERGEAPAAAERDARKEIADAALEAMLAEMIAANADD